MRELQSRGVDFSVTESAKSLLQRGHRQECLDCIDRLPAEKRYSPCAEIARLCTKPEDVPFLGELLKRDEPEGTHSLMRVVASSLVRAGACEQALELASRVDTLPKDADSTVALTAQLCSSIRPSEAADWAIKYVMATPERDRGRALVAAGSVLARAGKQIPVGVFESATQPETRARLLITGAVPPSDASSVH